MAGYILGRMFGLTSYKDKTQALVLTAQESMYKAILVLLTFTAILWMAIFLYASFYYTYMPAISHIRPVHLQFNSCGREKGLCTFPSANVTLTQRQQLLMVGQPYKVLVELEMPESKANQNLGMFMVCAELRDWEHHPVDKACRSAILHYKSWFHRAIATIVYFPFLLSGSAEEKQLVALELFSGFQEHPDRPATEAYIEIQSQHIEIYQTYLKIHAHFGGLRYFMFHWPLLAAMLGISSNFFFLFVIAFLSWYKFFNPKQVVVHMGYDGNAAETIEERRKDAARVKLEKERRERAELLSQQIIDEEQEIATKGEQFEEAIKPKKIFKTKDFSDEKSKLEMDEGTGGDDIFMKKSPDYASQEKVPHQQKKVGKDKSELELLELEPELINKSKSVEVEVVEGSEKSSKSSSEQEEFELLSEGSSGSDEGGDNDTSNANREEVHSDSDNSDEGAESAPFNIRRRGRVTQIKKD